jgi:hypothetical protein
VEVVLIGVWEGGGYAAGAHGLVQDFPGLGLFAAPGYDEHGTKKRK